MSYQPQYEGQPYMIPNSNMAVISLIAGILGLTMFPILGSIVALILGYMAKKEIRDSAGHMTGDGMATAGLVLGWIGVGLTVFGLCIAGAAIAIPLCGLSSYELFKQGSSLLLWLI